MELADIPREPSAYTPSLHFAQRFKDPERRLSGQIIQECIRHGEATYQESTGNVLLDATISGRVYRLVVDPQTREVCTGFPVSA